MDKMAQEALEEKINRLLLVKQHLQESQLSVEDLSFLYDEVRCDEKIISCALKNSLYFYTKQGEQIKEIKIATEKKLLSTGQWNSSNTQTLIPLILSDSNKKGVGVGMLVAKTGQYVELFPPTFKKIAHLDHHLVIMKDKSNRYSNSIIDQLGQVYFITIQNVVQDGFSFQKIPYRNRNYLTVVSYQEEVVYCCCHGIEITKQEQVPSLVKRLRMDQKAAIIALENINSTFLQGNFQKGKHL